MTGIQMRGGLLNIQNKWRGNEGIRAAFLGGSITEGAGASIADMTSWRALTGEYLAAKLGREKVTCINAGVGGTNSAFGAHRLHEHVLSFGAVDLLFVEFSVNDGNDGLAREESIRGMEGIVRHMRRVSPQTDLCFVYTAAEKNLSGTLPFNIAVHEQVAEHYGIPSVNFARRIYDLIQTGSKKWTDLAPDTYHPNDEGHALYAAYMREFLEMVLSDKQPFLANRNSSKAIASMNDKPLDPANFEFAGMVAPFGQQVQIESEGFSRQRLEPDAPLMNWRYDTEHLEAGQAGAELSFRTQGQGAGVVLLCGPDSGTFEFSVNGGGFKEINPFDEWCPLAYRPVMFLFPLLDEPGTLGVVIRSTGNRDERSQGSQLRVLRLLSN